MIEELLHELHCSHFTFLFERDWTVVYLKFFCVRSCKVNCSKQCPQCIIDYLEMAEWELMLIEWDLLWDTWYHVCGNECEGDLILYIKYSCWNLLLRVMLLFYFVHFNIHKSCMLQRSGYLFITEMNFLGLFIGGNKICTHVSVVLLTRSVIK